MASQALAFFAEQLANWGRQAIQLGRSPFRKVETGMPLLTEAGEQHAPLLFWINRDSFMAGGLLLFPRQAVDEVLADGCRLADAVGLQQFVTWSARDASIWQCEPEGAQLRLRIPLPEQNDNQVEPFHQLLLRIMDELKLLSVLSALPSSRLSAYYLANLCREAVLDSLDELAAQARMDRSQSPPTGQQRQPHHWATGKAYLTLFRLLTLLSQDRLPPNIQPEGLERALRFALPGLTTELELPLRFTHDDLPLPGSVAVRFHHLFRRLLQLELPRSQERTAAGGQILLREAATALLGQQDAAPLQMPATDQLTLLVNRALAPAPAAQLVEIFPQPLLAGRALLRTLQGEAAAHGQETDLWRLDTGLRFKLVLARLTAGQRPARELRLQMETSLRSTWPTRRFQFAPDSPAWLFQALHLLGLCRPEGELDLDLPVDWLTRPWGAPLWETLRSDFSPLRISLLPEERLQLQLRRSREPGPVAISGREEETLPGEELLAAPREQLYFRLRFPAEWLALLEAGLLVPPPAGIDEQQRQTLQLFFRSPPGRELTALAGLPAPPTSEKQLFQLLEHRVPVPPAERLLRLEGLLSAGPPSTMDADDDELLDWLGPEYRNLPPLASGVPHAAARRGSEQPRSHRDLPQRLAEEIFVDGIPRFPEHYLYDHYQPELISYRWQTPLRIDGAFFGQVRLSDGAGQSLEIPSESQARALLLIDRCGTEQVDLPADPLLTESILLRYLKDLQQLHGNLHRLACRQEADARAADRLVRKTWGRAPLPPWDEISAAATFFSLPGHVE